MEIGFATESQIEEISKLRMHYFQTECYDIAPDIAAQIYDANLAYLKKELNHSGYVAAASDQGKVVAIAYLSIIEKAANLSFVTGRYGEVYGVYTLPAYRRRGISSKLMELIIEKCRALNCSFVQLGATKEGFSVYDRLGFTDQEEEYRPMELRLI